MERQTIQPTDRAHWLDLRRQDLTSTMVPVLFGVGRISLFELWHMRHRGAPESTEVNTSMRWGSRLEPVIAQGIAEDEGWQVRHKTEYMRLPEHRIGASFDYETDAPALLEIKSVRSTSFRDGWVETDFGLEAPPAIEWQLQAQLLVSGLSEGYIGALVNNDTVHVLKREAYPDAQEKILRAVADFWAMKAEPEPDFLRDAEFIARMHGYAEPGKLIEATPEVQALAREYVGHATAKAQAEKAMAATKARILREIGDAERVLSPEFTLSAKVVKGGHVEYERGEYRGFRIFAKGEK